MLRLAPVCIDQVYKKRNNSMAKQRISITDIVIGAPLPWDVYDADNKLLLRRNFVIRDASQIEALVQRGLFVGGNTSGSDHAEHKLIVDKPSALRLINQANKRLGRLLYNMLNETDFEAKIMEVAAVLKTAVKISENVALATIMLNRAANPYSVRHCIDVAIVSLLISRSLNVPETEIDSVMAAALTMNVAMLRHQEQLQAKVGALTDEEKAIIRGHPQLGMHLLKQAGVGSEDWLMHVLMHHENETGSGYPLGQAGTKIPLGTKTIAVADRYCAQVSPRAYRKAMLPNAALRSILIDEKDHLDRAFAGAVILALGTYPPGAFVKLENGETAVVSRKGEATTTPIVHSLLGPRDTPLAYPIQRDTSLRSYAIRDLILESKAALHVSMQQLWGDEASL
jgi:HD-GYP domain-containing protein (c-di-GMP phosphodiesterase class II)